MLVDWCFQILFKNSTLSVVFQWLVSKLSKIFLPWMTFCHWIWFTEVLELNHLDRYQVNALFLLWAGSWKRILLTFFSLISFALHCKDSGYHGPDDCIFLQPYKVFPTKYFLGMVTLVTVFTLLFQTVSVLKNLQLLFSVMCWAASSPE